MTEVFYASFFMGRVIRTSIEDVAMRGVPHVSNVRDANAPRWWYLFEGESCHRCKIEPVFPVKSPEGKVGTVCFHCSMSRFDDLANKG